MGALSTCPRCGRKALVSASLGACRLCFTEEDSLKSLLPVPARIEARESFGLPPHVPCHEDGVQCRMCGNRCRIPLGASGFCGLRRNVGGRIVVEAGRPGSGLVDWYYDPLPTNCVASWVCAAGSNAGYPGFAYRRGPEYGYFNLAVFYRSCTFDCLFCQNWHFRERRTAPRIRTAEALSRAVNERTSCICYFGGDPSSQLSHALVASRLALEKAQGRILRICFETNGNLSRGGLQHALRLARESGGCIKFDLKAMNPGLHAALTGVSNQTTLDNFSLAARLGRERPDPPLVVASTLLIPGYVEAEEVGAIARFIAGIDPALPYSLLAFAPHFLMDDLPRTTRRQADACLEAARDAGLERINLSNVHLLW